MKKLISLFVVSIIVTTSFAQTVPTAESILTAAYKKATVEKKNIFIIFHASWCGWCKKLDASMNDTTIKKYFDKNYITVHLTVMESPKNKKLENPGADIFLEKYKGKEAGLPFFLIIDKNKKLIADSFNGSESIGCPANEAEVKYFISMLKKSSTINNEDLNLIEKRFRQNESH